MEDISEALGNGENAFGKVPYLQLLKKIFATGIQGRVGTRFSDKQGPKGGFKWF